MGCCLSKREDRNDYDLLTSDDIVGDVDGGLLSEQLQEFGFFRRATTMFRGRKSTKPAKPVAAAEAAVEDAAARLRRAEAAARVAFAERWVVGVRVALRDQWIAGEASHLRDQYAMDARTAARFVKQGHRHGKESMLQASVKKTRDAGDSGGRRGRIAVPRSKSASSRRRRAKKCEAQLDRSRGAPRGPARVVVELVRRRLRGDGEATGAARRDGAREAADAPREARARASKKRPWDDGHHVAPEADPAQPAAYRTLREKRAVAETDDASSYLDESLLLGRGSLSAATFDTTLVAAGPRAKRPESAPKRAMKDQLQDPEMPYKCKLQRPKSATGVAGMDVGPVVFERKARALLKKI
ncbi:actin binding protein [Aureococcus anophagefferens]|uniref:Actin binding protein n=1 Tax=Aureococcus anophagefferens TaxID=44056 RepID=A0ABR1FT08_AURAN